MENKEIKLYAAPMEGLTGFVWRRAHAEAFCGADKYFTPFVVANQTRIFKTKEKRDLGQMENNLVPQLLSDKAENFIWAIKSLEDMGFDEINLNLGCPSATVVTRGKGSGMLKDKDKLDAMLFDVFSACGSSKISIKTRIGFWSADEWPELFGIFEKYPIYELSVHARYGTQLYNGSADRKLFMETTANSKLTVVYNGDVLSPEDEMLSIGCPVMAGRGILRNPALFRQVKGGKKASREELIAFHDRLLAGYEEYMQGEVPTLHHMKEFWFYYSNSFNCSQEQMRKALRANRLKDYLSAVSSVMKNCELR